MVNDLQVFIMLLILAPTLFLLSIIAICIFKKHRKVIKKKIIAFKRKMRWNGAIRSFYISFSSICMSTSIQWKMLMRESRYVTDNTLTKCATMTSILMLGIFMMIFIITRYRNHLGVEKVKSYYENLYIGINYQRKQMRLYYWPIFFIRRIIFFMIPILLVSKPTQAL